MKHHVVAVHDRAINSYLRPFLVPALGAAIRSFQDEINNRESPMFNHPDDYDLYHLGDFDDATGRFTNLPEVKQIAIGKQLKTGADHAQK